MSKSRSQIFSRLQYFPYIVYVRKVKKNKFLNCKIENLILKWRHVASINITLSRFKCNHEINVDTAN